MEKPLAKILCERPVLKRRPLASMSEARRLIMQAQVKVNGKTVENPFAEIDETAIVTVGKEVPGA